MKLDSNNNLQSKGYFLSEVSKHTSDRKGYWMVIDNQVYDITTFIAKHPGGNVILKMHAGLDASSEFKRVGHDVDPIALKMLKKYRIGDFVSPVFTDKVQQAVYSKWVYCLSLCTEMLNAFSLDISMLSKDIIPPKEEKEELPIAKEAANIPKLKILGKIDLDARNSKGKLKKEEVKKEQKVKIKG